MKRKGSDEKHTVPNEMIWISTERMTVGVEINNNDVIVTTPPIVRRFKGKQLIQLLRWMGKQPGFLMEYIHDQ